MAYTTKAKVDALFGGNIDNTLFTSLLASIKAYIDQYCGKTFESASGDQYYDGSGCETLNIDPFTGTPTIVILDSQGNTERTLDASEFVTAPYNSTEKNQIILRGISGIGHFPHRLQSVKITANWGGSVSVPADIELAATRLIGHISANPQILAKTKETLGDYSVEFGEIQEASESFGVLALLDMHRDILI